MFDMQGTNFQENLSNRSQNTDKKIDFSSSKVPIIFQLLCLCTLNLCCFFSLVNMSKRNYKYTDSRFLMDGILKSNILNVQIHKTSFATAASSSKLSAFCKSTN